MPIVRKHCRFRTVYFRTFNINSALPDVDFQWFGDLYSCIPQAMVAPPNIRWKTSFTMLDTIF
jgi:hypothetical protein